MDSVVTEKVTVAAVPGSREPVEDEQTTSGLTELQLKMLDFERQWWKYAGAKEQAIKDLFGMSTTRYYQALNALIDAPGALAKDPLLVKRLRRLRTTRQQARAARRLGSHPERAVSY
jgi:hypothetical protein